MEKKAAITTTTFGDSTTTCDRNQSPRSRSCYRSSLMAMLRWNFTEKFCKPKYRQMNRAENAPVITCSSRSSNSDPEDALPIGRPVVSSCGLANSHPDKTHERFPHIAVEMLGEELRREIDHKDRLETEYGKLGVELVRRLDKFWEVEDLSKDLRKQLEEEEVKFWEVVQTVWEERSMFDDASAEQEEFFKIELDNTNMVFRSIYSNVLRELFDRVFSSSEEEDDKSTANDKVNSSETTR